MSNERFCGGVVEVGKVGLYSPCFYRPVCGRNYDGKRTLGVNIPKFTVQGHVPGKFGTNGESLWKSTL